MASSEPHAASHLTWHEKTQSTLIRVAKLKKEFRAKALAAESATAISQALKTRDANNSRVTDAEKNKALQLRVQRHKELAEVGKRLKVAKGELEQQFVTEAKRQCLPLCEDVHRILPRELRNAIYSEILTCNNATFYEKPAATVKLANGLNMQHLMDSAYTGSAMHKELLEELNRNGARFDFRHRPDLVSKVFQYYHNLGIQLSPILRSIGLTFNMEDLTKRETVFDHLKHLSKLAKGTKVLFFIETDGKTQSAMIHSFGMMLRMLFPTLQQLKDDGYPVKVVMNPSYIRSVAENSDACKFSLIHGQAFRYAFSEDKAKFSVEDFECKLRAYLEQYGHTWMCRLDLAMGEAAE